MPDREPLHELMPGSRERTSQSKARVHATHALPPFIIPVDIHIGAMYCASMIRKELVAASAEPLILSLLEHGDSYGYAIMQEIRARSEDQLKWTDGMLYPVLHRMEANGLLKSRWGKSETGRK